MHCTQKNDGDFLQNLSHIFPNLRYHPLSPLSSIIHHIKICKTLSKKINTNQRGKNTTDKKKFSTCHLQCFLLLFIGIVLLEPTLISGMVKLYQTPELSSALSVIDPNLIYTSLSLLFITPSVFPVTLRIFCFHQVELSIRMPHRFSSKEISPWLLKFWHELAEDWYSGVSIYMLALQRLWRFKSKHPTGTVTVNLIEMVSPSLTRYENDEG